MEDEEIQAQLEALAREEQARLEAEEKAAEEAIRAQQAAKLQQQQQKPVQQTEVPPTDVNDLINSIDQISSAVDQILAPVLEKSDGSETAKAVIKEMTSLIRKQVAPVISSGASVEQLMKEEDFVSKARAMALGSLMSKDAIKQPKSLDIEHTGTSTGADSSPAGQMLARAKDQFGERRVNSAIKEMKAAYPNLTLDEADLYRYLQATPGVKR